MDNQTLEQLLVGQVQDLRRECEWALSARQRNDGFMDAEAVRMASQLSRDLLDAVRLLWTVKHGE